uniref:mucin-5AC-like n=1 Tax=Styela clava TaxID=7725 RepID=UPI00193A83D4|nr:mucin-5AC-like [Styela clava]
MDYSDEVSDKQENKSKSKQKDSPSFKKQSGFAKLASKVTRKRSLKKDKQSKKEILDDSVFSSTEDSGNSALDQPISPADSGVSNSPPPMSGPTLVPLSKSTSKSEDSLDSGIYSRQKSCDSVDSIGSTESNGHTTDHTRPVMSYTTAGENNSKLDDTTNHQPMSAGKYDDFWREYQDIRQSIIVQDDDFDDRRSVTRTDSGGTDDEDEGDWFRQAGLADLVTTAALSQGAQSGPNEGNKENTAARLSTDSLTSMTILSTLTRPQREAVLRRITSFNRAQKSRRRPKPHINAVFPQNYGDSNTNNEGVSGKPPLAPPPSVEVTLSPTPTTENKKTSKSTSLPYNIGGFGDGEPYPRRYSEVTHRPTGTNMTDTDGHFLSTSIVSAYSTSSLEAGHVVKLDQKGYQRKEALDSIVATEPSVHPSHIHASNTLPPPSSSNTHSCSLSRSQAFLRARSISAPNDCTSPSDNGPLTSSTSGSDTPDHNEAEFAHFTFSPGSSSSKHKEYSHLPSSVSFSGSVNAKPPSFISPNKSFLHGVSQTPKSSILVRNRVLSSEFTSHLSPSTKQIVVEPFEFSPITLTTSTTATRKTKVIRSTPTSPNVQALQNELHRINLTTSVFSKSPSPISSILPSSSPQLTVDCGDTDKISLPKEVFDLKNTGSNPTIVASSSDENQSTDSSSVTDLHDESQQSDDSFISFTSALNLSSSDVLQFPNTPWHTLPSSHKPHRNSSFRSRRTKSTTLSPRRKSLKYFQMSLPKVSTLSVSSLTTSPTHHGSYKLRRHSPKLRRLKRASSLYGEPASFKGTLDSSSKRKSSSGIETLSIQTRSTEDTSWRDNFTEDNNNKSKQPMSYSETADQENLPNFSLVKDRLGITRISDLSAKDIGKVQSLALIELTALFDLHNIELKRRKFGKPKIKETGLFGIPLTTLLESDQKRQSNPQLRIPLVLRETITFLENNGLQDEGILRVPGSAVRIKNLKQELESKFSQTSPTVLLDSKAGWNEARTNDVAALLKQFLRELPNPLLTQEYIDAFQSCDLIPDRKQQLQALNLLIILLNDVHRDSLKLLLKFLSRVVAKEEVNKMTLNNVAMIMAPNLFMAKKQSKRGETPSALAASQDVKHAAGTSNIVRMLIKYHKLLWTVPTFMLTQVRNMNQAEQSSKKHGHGQSKDKLKIKFPGITKSKDPATKLAKSPLTQEQQFEYEVPKGVIRVKVENHSMTSMAVQLDIKSSAGDVIGKFQKQCERRKQMQPDSDITVITNETHALYEVGGNIFERCLDPGTNMHALTKINPEATWVIKGRVDGS